MRTARLTILTAAICLVLWLPGCESVARDGFRNGTYSGSAGQVLTISGDEFTYSYLGYAAGAVSCPTLMSDAHRTDEEMGSTERVLVQTLKVAPDQSDQIPTSQNKTYLFYALIQGDTGDVVEVWRPSAPAGWSLRLGDATGANDLSDTDQDGIPDLGYVTPGESCWFSLEVMAASGLAGDTAFIQRFTIAAYLGSDSLVADTALLSLTVLPAPLSGTYVIDGHSATFTTTQINGHPIGLQLSTTFDFTTTTNSIILTNIRNLLHGGCGITPDTYTKGSQN